MQQSPLIYQLCPLPTAKVPLGRPFLSAQNPSCHPHLLLDAHHLNTKSTDRLSVKTSQRQKRLKPHSAKQHHLQPGFIHPPAQYEASLSVTSSQEHSWKMPKRMRCCSSPPVFNGRQTKVTEVGVLTVSSRWGKDPPWRMDTAYMRVNGCHGQGEWLVRENVPGVWGPGPRKEWGAATSYVHNHHFPPFLCLLLFSRPVSLQNPLDLIPSPKLPTPIQSGLFPEQS